MILKLPKLTSTKLSFLFRGNKEFIHHKSSRDKILKGHYVKKYISHTRIDYLSPTEILERDAKKKKKNLVSPASSQISKDYVVIIRNLKTLIAF